MTFALDLSRLCEKAKGEVELAMRKIMLELFQNVILKSPVDTGRFRANWQVGYSSPNLSITDQTDISGSTAIGRMTQQVVSASLDGKSIFLTNSLPYAHRLENGWSKQAPSGMVRLSMVEITNQYGA